MPPGAADTFSHRNSHREMRVPERSVFRSWQRPHPHCRMNIPASSRAVKGRHHHLATEALSGPESPDPAPDACALVRAAPVTCLLLVATRGVHLVSMATPPAPERLIRLFPGRQPWPRQVFASSLAVHALGFALVGWATHGRLGAPISTSSQRVTRPYAVRYLVLNRLPISPGPRPERRPTRPLAPAAPVRPSATLPVGVNVVESASQRKPLRAPQSAPPSAPRRPSIQTEALAPGATVGIGQIVPTSHSDSTGSRGLTGMLGFRGPTAAVEPAKHGLDRLPELVGAASSACPDLPPPAASSTGHSAVAVAFVVDTNGKVDRATLQVVESPGRPRTDRQFHARVYVVGATGPVDHGRPPPVANDSVLTEDVASHVAGLMFRPALRADRVIRSTVLVSCQTN
jgi:hypothetical protein